MEPNEYLNRSMQTAASLSTMEYFIIGAGLLFILGWLILCVFWARTMLMKFTYSTGVNPYKTETLGLPRGSVRGLISLTLLIVVIVMICMSLLVQSFRGAFDSLIDAFQVMLAFYFGSKVMHHVTSADRGKTEYESIARKETAIAEAKVATAELVIADFEVGGAVG